MTLYGTRILSDISLPLLPGSEGESLWTLELRRDPPAELVDAIRCGFPLYRAHGRRVFFYSDRSFDESVPGQAYCYEISNVLRFYWRGGEGRIYYRFLNEGTPLLLTFWLAHLVLPLYLTLERRYHLFHAGAVEIEGRPVLFLAPSTGGKSTMTDCFLRRGHALISDDKVATFRENGRITVVPAHPYHRPWRSFEELGQRAERFVTRPRPLHALYLLERAAPDAPVTFEEIRGMEKLRVILPHFLYQFPFLKREQLAYLAPLLDDLPLIRVTRPWNLERLDEVHDAICTFDAGLGERME